MRSLVSSLVALVIALSGSVLFSSPAAAADADLATRLRELRSSVVSPESELAARLPRMLADDVRARIASANRRSSTAWAGIRRLAQWETFRNSRIQALRRSLGRLPAVAEPLKTQTTGTFIGDGFRIENLVFESRPGLMVTANLYAPIEPIKSMPGILICHSHHNPKAQGELQDMGMTWARQGCLVLVMDQLGHGERRQHPFRSERDYPGAFRLGRQDYYFRYNTGIQLHLVGESLIGWMVTDLMRGVDLLLTRPGIDKNRIILIGSVAGGGDPAAVAAALDSRIAAAVPFNFGGPQPETVYPLPANAEDAFSYAGSGGWESTRNLRSSARDGFLPWVIVGALAPRRLAYAHEFSWDSEHDPVWRRLQRIHGLFDAVDHLGPVYGRGVLRGRPPEATHCNNVGAVHRAKIYALFARWFDMTAPDAEYQMRLPSERLRCRTPMLASEFRPVHEIAAELGSRHAQSLRDALRRMDRQERRIELRHRWSDLLGRIEPPADPKRVSRSVRNVDGIGVERILLGVEREVLVPLLLLTPHASTNVRPPLVVAIAQSGKESFLRQRSETIAALLEAGVAVLLPDVRGTGETRPDTNRGRRSAATAISSSEMMLGQTLVGSRLFDLRAVLRYMRSRDDINVNQIALWGDSFAPANSPDHELDVPLDADPFPEHSEPLGGLLALLGALFEDSVRAVYIHGGLVGYDSILDSPFVYVPHDVVVPRALTVGDLSDLAASLAPLPMRLEALVDGLNRTVRAGQLNLVFEHTRAAYDEVHARRRFRANERRGPSLAVARWIADQM